MPRLPGQMHLDDPSGTAAIWRRRARRAALLTAAALNLALVVSLISAGAASALGIEPLPISPVTVAIPIAKAIVTAPLKAVTSALLSVLQAIFGGVEAKLLADVITGLLAIPNFNNGHVASLEQTTSAISLGMLGSVLTLSIFRYYLAGLSDSGSGGFEAIQGVVRVVGAVGFIVAWPGVFGELVQIPKMFDGALLGSSAVQGSVAALFDAALVVGGGAFVLSSGLGLIFVVLMALLGALVFIGLLWMKVLLSVMMMFLFVSMPLCIVMWPVPELAWLAAAAMRSMFVALLVPCVWAIVFALAAAVNTDVLAWAPSHNIVDTVVIRPLAGITLMLLCISLPRFLMRQAMIGPAGQARGGGRIWRTVTFGLFALRGVSGAARTVAAAANEGQETAQRLIDRLPQQAKPPGAAGEGSLAGRIIFGRSGFGQGRDEPGDDAGGSDGGLALLDPEGDPPTEAAGGVDAGAAAVSDDAAETHSSDTPAEQPPAATGTADPVADGGAEEASAPPQQQPASAGNGASGDATPGAAPARQTAGSNEPGAAQLIDQAGAGMYQESRAVGSSAEDVADAFARLRPSAQRAIADGNPDKLRDSIARTLHNPRWTDGEREALWTIGSARLKEVNDGIALAQTRQRERAGGESPASPSASLAESGPSAPATDGTASGGQPPRAPASENPAGGAGGQAPPPAGPPPESGPGGRSLGSGLTQQLPATSEPPPVVEPPDLPDAEPFLD